MLSYSFFPSPIGELAIIANQSELVGLKMLGERPSIKTKKALMRECKLDPSHPIINATTSQLSEYFAKKRQVFELCLKLAGSEFEKAVWQALLTIPYGKRAYYSDVAHAINRPKAIRAVGTAVGKNPVAIIVPCNRVVPKAGGIGQFGGGVRAKNYLLDLERSAAALAPRA